MEDTCSHRITTISLDATAMDKPLYEKGGFVFMSVEMELPFLP